MIRYPSSVIRLADLYIAPLPAHWGVRAASTIAELCGHCWGWQLVEHEEDLDQPRAQGLNREYTLEIGRDCIDFDIAPLDYSRQWRAEFCFLLDAYRDLDKTEANAASKGCALKASGRGSTRSDGKTAATVAREGAAMTFRSVPVYVTTKPTKSRAHTRVPTGDWSSAGTCN